MFSVQCSVFRVFNVNVQCLGGIETCPSPASYDRTSPHWIRVQGSGFSVQGSGFSVQGVGFEVCDLGVGSLGIRVLGSGFGVWSLGFGVGG